MLCDNAVSRYQEEQSCKVARIVLLLQIVPGTKVKKVYDTIQLSRATAVSFQLSRSSVEDDPSFDMAKAQQCAPVRLLGRVLRAVSAGPPRTDHAGGN